MNDRILFLRHNLITNSSYIQAETFDEGGKIGHVYFHIYIKDLDYIPMRDFVREMTRWDWGHYA